MNFPGFIIPGNTAFDYQYYEQKKKEKAAAEQAARRQAELNRLADQRRAIAAQQKARQEQLQVEADQQLAANQATVNRLRGEQEALLDALKVSSANKTEEVRQASMAEAAKIREATGVRVEGLKRAGGAASTSLRILAQPQVTAPKAQQTPRSKRRRGAALTSANVARGSAQQRGSNLSI